MNNKKNLLISLSVVTSLALNASANEEKLGEVTIHDTALEAHIKSITSDKLENQQASDIKDILKSIPGVDVDGNIRYGQKVYVRGLEDKSSGISIDGARMTGQLFHHSGDQTIDAEMLKIGSIELGPNSALSGPGVINGSFVYETKDPSDFLEEGQRFGGKITAGYQSAYGRKSGSLSLFGKVNDKLEIVAMGNRVDDQKVEVPDLPDEKSKQSELKSGLLKFVVKANDENTIKLAYNTYEDGGNRQDRGEFRGSLATDEFYNEVNRETYTLNYEYNPNNDLIKLNAKLYNTDQSLYYGARTDDWFGTTRGETANEPAREFFNINRGVDIRNTSFIDNHKITYGASIDEEEQKMKVYGSSRLITGGTRAGQTEALSDKDGGESRNTAIYIEDEIDLDKLLLTIGARYDIHKLSGIYKGESKQLSPKLRAEYQATDELKLRAGYGRIFKGPGFGEASFLYMDTTQDANTKAQTGNNYEIGFDYDLAEKLNADNSLYGFTAFTYNVDNYMHPASNVALSNQSNIDIWGVESIFKYQKDKVGLSLSHTYTDGEQKDISTGSEYKPKGAKIHTFKVDADYKYSSTLSFNYNGEFVPGNKTRSFRRGALRTPSTRPGFGVHNISTTYKLASLKGAKINFGIDNVLDKRYAKHTSADMYYGFSDQAYEVGRNYKIKFTYQF